jgi:predicted DNA-binding transcriptional regulator YafY
MPICRYYNIVGHGQILSQYKGNMAKVSNNARRYRIFQILCARSEDSALSSKEVHQILLDEGDDIDERTVRRDLSEHMRDFKLLETDGKPNRYWAERKNYNPEYELALTADNLFTIFIALDALKNTSPDPMQELCDETLVTLADAIPESLQESYNYFKLVSQTQEGVSGRSVAKDPKSFNKLITAVIDGSAFSCKIHSPLKDPIEREVIRKFYPVFFTFTNNIPYLHALDLEKREFRQLRMTRLVDVKLIEDREDRSKFEEKARKELKASYSGYSGQNTYDYEIICDQKMADYFLEKELCENQKVEEILQDTRYKITFTLSKHDQIIRLLAGFGGHIESIRPVEISKEVTSIWKNSYKKAA